MGGGEIIDDLGNIRIVDRCAINLDHLGHLGLPEILLEFGAARLGVDIVGRVAGGALFCTTSRLGPGLNAAVSSGSL
jgi:hypothetical protein